MARDPKSVRIVFMGTPDFAVASLQGLLDNGFTVVGVITAPDKPAGRGLSLQSSPVKQLAIAHHIPLLQPAKLKDPDFLKQLAAWKPDLQVVVAFRMLPELVWSLPPMGTINLHGSLLPDYRGAAPINWALINGEQKTGVTTFLLKHEIDTGDLLLQQEIAIEEKDNFGTLYNKLKMHGAKLLTTTIERYVQDRIAPIPQNQLAPSQKPAPKLQKETGAINWDGHPRTIHNLIRGLSPTPGAYANLQGKFLKIFQATPIEEKISVAPGTIDTDGKTFLRFACTQGWLQVEELQLEGKKRMNVASFLQGFRF
ncbi:MAG: methionyl-tRNA formyltransferase [Bacteroidetes bacterium]|nr:methionyl-tRNA formyltransferase [Bacteroidota bacterium]